MHNKSLNLQKMLFSFIIANNVFNIYKIRKCINATFKNGKGN